MLSELREIMAPWVIVESRGDGWEVERPPHGSNELPSHPDIIGGGCFVSSFSSCVMRQEINLKEKVGCLSEIITSLEPAIHISDW